MKVKEHYDRHLGNFYTWMTGNFFEKWQEQLKIIESFSIRPKLNTLAFDLGAGHGIQSLALSSLGFKVTSVDFNKQLLHHLELNRENTNIEIRESDILEFLKNTDVEAELIVCMGDTLTHLESIDAVDELFKESSRHLSDHGKLILSFRDLTIELKGEQRFIPVKSDEQKILTCFLEYFTDHVMVHDILHEKQDGKWVQKISAYPKLRLSEAQVKEMLTQHGLKQIETRTINRMVYLVAQKV